METDTELNTLFKGFGIQKYMGLVPLGIPTSPENSKLERFPSNILLRPYNNREFFESKDLWKDGPYIRLN
jgi:hypothetical protein